MSTNRNDSLEWCRVTSRAHLQLSADNPPTSRPGPIIGPASRVRPCASFKTESKFGVMCLDVDDDGRIQRGYTIKHMVSFAPERPARTPRWRLPLVGAVVFPALLIAATLVFR